MNNRSHVGMKPVSVSTFLADGSMLASMLTCDISSRGQLKIGETLPVSEVVLILSDLKALKTFFCFPCNQRHSTVSENSSDIDKKLIQRETEMLLLHFH